MTTVRVPAIWTFRGEIPVTKVQLGDDGAVYRGGECIGYCRKGSRTYSPPVHKGSRIVKYNKQVPEWHGWGPGGSLGRPDIHKDSRRQVLSELIADAVKPPKDGKP